MKERKLVLNFTKSNIEIKSEDGEINMGIPYRFDNQYGKENMQHFLAILGFAVKIKEGDKE